MNEFERSILLYMKEMSNSLKSIDKSLTFISRDLSITEDEKDIGIASIVADMRNSKKDKK